MARLPIIIAPDPRLKAKSVEVRSVDGALRRFIDDMVATMYAAPGIGLAAPQVGLQKRVIVVDPAEDDKPKLIRLINPTVVATADALVSHDEGCLSLPDFYEPVDRPGEIEVSYVDYNGEPRTLAASGLLARCIQHEIDHLDGVLFVDHVSALKRNIILRKLVKAKKQKLLESA